MENSKDVKKLELDKIQWSTDCLTASEFLSKFKLPQIVKVMVGFYGESSESTLNADQVLCLHSVKSTKKVHGHDSSGKEITISLECQKKVEVHPSKLKDIYENVEELCSVFPKYVRVTQGQFLFYTNHSKVHSCFVK